MKKFILLFNTVKYLKSIQIYYRLYYFARRRIRNLYGFHYPLAVASNSAELRLEPSIASYRSVANRTFSFLNLSHTFDNEIDWNYSEYGKLWTYNLTYFDFLQQEEMSKEKGLELIYDFIEQSSSHKDALEPFPVSLRGINWVKFLTNHAIKDQKIDDSLYAQYKILMNNLEYHLLGNHLLENGFSLLFGAYYFQDEELYDKAKEILVAELDEQILDDGAHFELSPMYHQIMLFRVLDCINLVTGIPQGHFLVGHSLLVIGEEQENELESLLIQKTEQMLSWLNIMTFENGDIPLLNDSANGIAPTTEQLNAYAKELQITNHESRITNHELRQSGYRKITKPNYEMIVDIGSIGPEYQPGHAHSDTFNFELYITPATIHQQLSTKIPFIIDTGLSTYETNKRRTQERSTASHNTVELDGLDQSEVWGGFRVADRAYVISLEEDDDRIKVVHDGYEKRLGALHQREFLFQENSIEIIDTILSDKEHDAVARFHFHPDVTEEMIHERIQIKNYKLKIKNYMYTSEFNRLIEAKMLEITFKNRLECEIKI